jgi:hypothetical protein
VFTSSEETPGGHSRLRVTLRLETHGDGTEIALLRSYEAAHGDAPLAPVRIDFPCAARLAAPAGAIAVLTITPPPARLQELIDACVPDGLFGAATDILPLLLVQAQPVYRAGELTEEGQRFRFPGYVTGWQRPPAMPDARIVADSGTIRLGSLGPERAVLVWDTSPMQVDIVRKGDGGAHMLLHGREWFVAEIIVDPRDGRLLAARTRADSLVLDVVAPYAGTTVPARGAEAGPARATVTIRRSLSLRLVP